ncbi:Oligosaccharyl transferase complex, subunit Wbp1 [Cordyceps fumosorosea ARSEF 2679]|uniref:Dolichyl-diphosphooligosaccharide--protein glycosyltransferase subunit WBP1 n=1 Tax=Cordyceps fumosorosea (strain ARSEF 2679) TaxID=1081104 RepID=A0A167WKE6_CORFA|nr:Oligosaccharyl transferase complex, subunit Wbp1 [Cordyceps fumosorosea ARSEF 2679]OAA63903.1 Oligosaccharyl transferase complex, subunit Wbp1 [Cordyceps fumosorosea ARSEF 2679]
MRLSLSVVISALAAATSALSTTGSRLLVVLDDVADKAAYGKFFGDLAARGFDINYETPRSDKLSLFDLGERKYDHLIFLPTKVKALGPNLTPNLLVDFVNAQGNIMVGLSSTTPTTNSIVSLLAELDISLPAERTGTVVDHFHYDAVSAPETHDVLVLDAPAAREGVKPYFALPGDAVLAVPHTAGHVLGNSHLLTPILRAPDTAYSYNPKEQAATVEPDELFAAGRQLALVSALQARNSARVSVLAAEMLQDKWLDATVAKVDGPKSKTENKEFARRISGWTFQEIGVLRVNDVEHRLVGSNEPNPSLYRIKNDVTYAISLSEYSWDKWVPFAIPDQDALQLEFSMLSPFHRLSLAPVGKTADAATYGVKFTTPDQHGIFNFLVNYKRPFLTSIEEKRTVSVRHMAHDEWPRSYAISGAWPWIAGIAATVSGFVAFSALWMYSKPTETKKTQ